jgi:hypothetical protein
MLRVNSAFLGAAMLLGSTAVLAKEGATGRESAPKAVYCWQGANGQWSLHRFKPLIQVNGGTVFAELTFAASVLEEVRVRKFYADSELSFDYTFDITGKLKDLKGSVQVKTVAPKLPGETEPMQIPDWLGEAMLTPGADGKIPPHHVFYSREKDHIEKPDDADKYIAWFNGAPVYRTISEVPCAARMKEAKEMNATQE